MIKPPLLSIIILSSDRFDLLQHTISSLLDRLEYPHFELIVYNHQGSHEEGLIKLINQANGEYLFNCEDDWFFMEKGNWVARSISILDKNPTVGMVKLRKEGDGQPEHRVIESIEHGVIIDDCGYSNNPFIARTSDIQKVLSKIDKPTELYIEKKMVVSFKESGHQVAKLTGYNKNGVCVHTGWNRQVGKNNWDK